MASREPGMAETKTGEEPVDVERFAMPAGRRMFDSKAYSDLANAVRNAAMGNRMSVLRAKRLVELVADACYEKTGTQLSEAAKEDMDPILKFRSYLGTAEEELLETEKSVLAADKLSEQEKKRFSDCVRRTISLQRDAQARPVTFMIYVGRDSETGNIFQMAPVHVRYFEVWSNKLPGKPNTLIMAPPGHAKSTCLRYFRAWKIGKKPNTRCLIITDEKGKAQSEVMLLKRIMRDDRFRAVFPDMRVLDRGESGADTNTRFAVSRKNTFSREFTVEGAAYQSRINGSGYDWITPDDMCPPEVSNQPTVREDANRRWDSVIQERLRDPANSEIDMICTPWHEDDVSGRVQRLAAEGRATNWTIAVDPFRINDDGNGMAIPIWDRFPVAHFEDRKNRLGQRYTLNYRLTAREKKQRAVSKLVYFNADADGSECRHLEEKFSSELQTDRMVLEVIRSGVGERWLSIDPSATANRGSSDNGVLDVTLSPKGFGYATDVWSLSLGPGAMQEWIVERIVQAIAEGRPIDSILLEATGGMKGMVTGWIDNIKRMCKERDIHPVPAFVEAGVRYSASQNMSKGARLREASGYIESGMIRFAGRRYLNHNTGETYCAAVKNSDMHILADRMIHFNSAGKTDGIDAASQWVLTNRHRLFSEIEKDEEPESEYRDPKVAALNQQMKEATQEGDGPSAERAFTEHIGARAT